MELFSSVKEDILKHTIFLYIAILLAWFIPATVTGGQPTVTLKAPIDQVISILNDPQYTEAVKKQDQRQALWDAVYPIFDYAFISKSVLGRFHWNNTFSPEQQQEFIDVFSQFIGNNYLDKIQDGYEGEKVIFENEELLSPKKAIAIETMPFTNANTICSTTVTTEGVSSLLNANTIATATPTRKITPQEAR